MADSDTSKPDSSTPKIPDLDFDLGDLDLGDLDFEENPITAGSQVKIPAPRPLKDPLGQDLASLLSKADERPIVEPEPEPDKEPEEPDTPPATESEQEEGGDPATIELPEEGVVEGERIAPPEVEIDEGEEEIDVSGDEEEQQPPPEPSASDIATLAPPANTRTEPLERPQNDALDVVFDDDDLELNVEFEEETKALDAAAATIEQVASDPPPGPTPRAIPLAQGIDDLTDDIAEANDDIAPLELETPPTISAGETLSDDDAAAEGENSDMAEKKKTLRLPSFKPLELVGIAAVLAVCLGALIMLSNTVNGTLKVARESLKPVAESVPGSIEGELISLAGIECYWRNRQDTDRVDENSTILPVVEIASGSGEGKLQILFLDPDGKIRGDAHTFGLAGGEFSPGGASTIALSTEGLANEVQFAAYRASGENAADERWTASIRESPDGVDWVELLEFEIPAERLPGKG